MGPISAGVLGGVTFGVLTARFGLKPLTIGILFLTTLGVALVRPDTGRTWAPWNYWPPLQASLVMPVSPGFIPLLPIRSRPMFAQPVPDS